ncbi:MAG TPA: CBS domain-containing protein [Polyangiaceae bacterium]|nr:CBS domain-containing protein [Polyangiaceae bacterium]
MNVTKVMTSDVVTCAPSDSLNRAAQIMWENDCGFLPVVEDGCRLVGVVTDRDICMGAYTQGRPLSDIAVDNVMARQIQTCKAEDEIASVERLMRDNKLRRVPVVDESSELLGVVTLGDLARCSQAGPLQKALGGLAISKTLASICEPRSPQQTSAAAQ